MRPPPERRSGALHTPRPDHTPSALSDIHHSERVGQDGDQLSLDDLPAVARTTDPPAAWAATRDPGGYRRRLVDEYLCTLARLGTKGATVSELQRVHGGESGSIARRLTDTYRAGLTRREGVRRSVRTTRWQTVHLITDSGMRHVAAVLARTVAS